MARNKQKRASAPRKNKGQRKARGGAPRIPRGVPGGAVRKVCSITDPFCPGAFGSRWPDGVGVKTAVWTLKTSFPLATTADGNGALFVSPGNFPYVYDTNYTAGVNYTSPATLLGAGGNAVTFSNNNFVKNFRLTSAGVRVVPTAPATANGGFITINTISGFPVSGALQPYGSMAGDECENFPIAQASGATWVAKPIGPGARMFYPPSTSSTFLTDTNDWSACTITLNGATPSTASNVLIELYFHYEVTFGTQASASQINQMAIQSPPANPVVQSSASSVLRTVDSILPGGTSQRENIVQRAATGALRGMAGMAANYFFPGSGAAALMLTNAANVD